MARSTRCALVAVCTAFLIGPAGHAAAPSADACVGDRADARPQSRAARLRAAAPSRARARRDRRATPAARAARRKLRTCSAPAERAASTSAETTFALSQVIELGDKRELRVGAAHATRSDRRRRARSRRARRAGRSHAAASSTSPRTRSTWRSRCARRRSPRTTSPRPTARVAAARAPDVELRRARVTSARVAVEQEHAEHELLTSRRKLAAMWGDSEATFERVSADLYALPPSEGYEALVARLASNPDFTRFASEERLRDAELRVAEAHARTDLTVRAGVRLLHDTNDEAFVFGVTLPLRTNSRARNEIAAIAGAARADGGGARSPSRARRGAAVRAVPGAAPRDHRGRSPAHDRAARDARRRSKPRATRSTAAATAISNGSTCSASSSTCERALIDAAANAHLYRTEIERLTGEPLTAPTEALP